MPFHAGDTLNYYPREGLPKPHLHMVISDGEQCSDRVVLINLTSWKPRISDETCVLDVGDHPFIKQKTVVFYREARIAKAGDLEEAEQCDLIYRDDVLDASLLRRIQEGAMQSDQTPRCVKEFLRDQGIGL